ncbi:MULTISPECIES: DUF5318 family protein [Gordonia]|uniref:DUF5318 domain-containing protein n=2 Tax=Gordonia TaxID=2053 RepID=L7LMH0_9ACTN|nr:MULTISPECIES: DUF5318 family protein [Gordonia]AUH67555.1 hypothetical protein CXX93_03305 [Gordonia sp. YC-JH1]KXT56929.1 hypothetical protein Y710_10580 [Gordonia sp. QH-12]GAC61302.1 hypothetical protein GSI01S_16_00270 [Gordonia sihwensis NBRC 108236]
MHRQIVDYALARRECLARVRTGRTALSQVCDADPYLLRAAKFHGKPTDEVCPVCRKEQVTVVSWVFGEHLGHIHGSARSAGEIEALDGSAGAFTVHVVEVCRTCRWNYLVQSYVAGLPEGAGRRRRRVAK